MPDEVVAPVRRSAWWRRVSGRMDQASSTFSSEMHGLAVPGRKLDDAFYDDLTEVLIAADCGVELSERLVTALRQRARREKLGDAAEAIAALKAEILAVMGTYDRSLNLSDVPSVVLVVGVNGSGKTTTIGKLAYRLREEGRSSLIAAADTYRAAARPSPRRTHPAPPRSTRCGSGRTEPAPTWSRTSRVPTPARWCSTPSRPPRLDASMWSWSTPRDACTRRSTSWPSWARSAGWWS